ncbi:signal peptidase I [Ruminiclostridium papyrosolvens DSM 2782]|uniref:Signal peptidase I n=1 Tax=Ruminiclostridium papyrosolvens DSM 2782 TaxID=588581 RepID=F1TGE2_9FIRM|nr:signal peptidase I [Ruminiclostridium papyrosolvens]EGD46507.1 signal peptidase I [Ruminiclostridium papyrosolvens DSM 2782]WES35238.1 signal peptidase I [Ruminiclostridium papyrosolvens DSM 2782]
MKILRELLGWVGTILGSVVLALIVIIFIFQPTSVDGHSMDNTLHDKEKIIINKTQNIFHGKPKYGDIVIIDSRVDRKRTFWDNVIDPLKYNILVSKFTENTQQIFWVKRVIGKAGDELQFKDGKVIRNGITLEEKYIKEPMRYQSENIIKVPEDCVFVMGDNRNESKDSRVIGPVPNDHVVGKYLFKLG